MNTLASLLNPDLEAGVQCRAFFCESLLFETARGLPVPRAAFCCVTSATGPIPSQNKNNQVALNE
ncbi:hypothetical protein BZK31_09720 [Pseudomonas floridensis]|uniref:Uncharacterized protein n=1 Tax=Pseudomonas floridensis TaxID=1958950 RepID=A0A1X0N835_9PSED|nr:hypothetical protein BZK31_09720 [Pseudomonas floridensis]